MDFNCEIDIKVISITDLSEFENVQFIDVRESHELPKIINLTVTSIPLSELENSIDKIENKKQKVFFFTVKHAKKLYSLNIKNHGKKTK